MDKILCPERANKDTLYINAEEVPQKVYTTYSGSIYTEVYEVVTDSIVNRFGLQFRSSDNAFIKKISMGGISRKLYDRMKEDEEFVSSPVWLYFKLLKIFGK